VFSTNILETGDVEKELTSFVAESVEHVVHDLTQVDYVSILGRIGGGLLGIITRTTWLINLVVQGLFVVVVY
jgi:hypothetical protein